MTRKEDIGNFSDLTNVNVAQRTNVGRHFVIAFFWFSVILFIIGKGYISSEYKDRKHGIQC